MLTVTSAFLYFHISSSSLHRGYSEEGLDNEKFLDLNWRMILSKKSAHFTEFCYDSIIPVVRFNLVFRGTYLADHYNFP